MFSGPGSTPLNGDRPAHVLAHGSSHMQTTLAHEPRHGGRVSEQPPTLTVVWNDETWRPLLETLFR